MKPDTLFNENNQVQQSTQSKVYERLEELLRSVNNNQHFKWNEDHGKEQDPIIYQSVQIQVIAWRGWGRRLFLNAMLVISKTRGFPEHIHVKEPEEDKKRQSNNKSEQKNYKIVPKPTQLQFR